ncbi:hypothetical protein LTR08_003737 [Meristemomyces frigidus]|nr:hypothetical protein LTR08_003737 [Meristemomyces frigidus]
MSTPVSVAGFGTSTSDDRRPWLWVASIVSCTYSILILAARLMSKLELLAGEDAIIGVAYLFGVAHWALLDRATYVGLGTNAQQQGNFEEEAKLFLSSQVTLMCAVYLSKISVLWFGRRIFAGTKLMNARSFEIAIAFAAVCGVASVAILAAGCDFRYALGSPAQHCSHFRARWTACQVLDAITEISIVALPTYYISMNTIKASSKITVITLFGLRLPCVAFMAATAASYESIEHGVAAHAKSITPAAIWAEVLLGYALSSASFPCIRTFMTAFLADNKFRIHDTSMGSYNQRSRNGTGQHHGTQRSARITSVMDNKPDAHMSDEAESVASDASQRIMIKRSVEIEVATQTASSGDESRWEPRPEFPYQGGASEYQRGH